MAKRSHRRFLACGRRMPLGGMAIALVLALSLIGCGDDDRAMSVDAGLGDAATPDGATEDASTTDGGTRDGGGTDTDGGTGPADGGAGPTDSGTDPADGGTGPADGGGDTDGGTGPADGGTGPADGGPTDSGTDAGPADAGAAPVTCTEPGLTLETIMDSASVGTPDSYFRDVRPGDPFCAEITGGGSGTWTVNVSNGTSSGLHCSGSATCAIRVPAGDTTLIVTAVTTGIGGYTLRIRRIPP